MLGLGEECLVHQFLLGNINIAKICQCWHTHLLETVIIKSSVTYLIIIWLTIVLTNEVYACMTILALIMTLIYHYLILKCHAANLLFSTCVSKGFNHKVVFLRHHHELHTLLPVAKTVVFKVLTYKILRGFLFILLGFCKFILHMGLGTLLYTLSLNNVRVALCRCCQKGNRHTGRKNSSFHDYL